MKTVLAVDGNSIINRAFFGAGRPLTNGKGQRTEAIYGMINMILSACDKTSPECVTVAFDVHAPTFRHKAYDLYKSNRRGMPEDLCAQLDPAKSLLRAFGFRILELPGYEADDLLGTVSAKAEEAGMACVIFTGDRDSLQLISDRTSVLLSGKETLLFDRAAFKEKYGIEPERFVDAKALMGDPSDCIPGVPGVGEKTALPLIASFGSLGKVYDHLDDPSIKAGLRAKLEAGRESAKLSYSLSMICRDAPVAVDLSPTLPRAGLRSALTDLGFFSILPRLGSLSLPSGGEPETPLGGGAQPLTERTPGEAENPPAGSLTVYERVSPKGALPVLSSRIAAAISDKDLLISDYDGKDYLFPDPDARTLTALLSGRRVVCCDSKELYAWLDARGVPDFEAAGDLSLAAYVLNSTDGDYSERALCARYLGKPRDVPDARALIALDRILSARLEEEGAQKLCQEIELPLSRVLFECEKAGILVDREGIVRFGEELKGEIADLEKEIYALAGHEFNVNSPKQLGAVLYGEMRLSVPGMKKTKNGYSTNAETLEKLRFVPIVDAILSYRQLSKLRSTYTEGLIKVIGKDGRIRTRFTQTVTATGRLSSVEPNLQNIPVRTRRGREMRRFFIAPEGRTLIDADYSQIELRLLACISGDETMINAFRRGADIHRITASQVFGVPEEEVSSELRKRAKAVNFGIVYGISAYSLAEDIGVSQKEADRYIKSYFATYPGIASFLTDVVKQAKTDGFVTTLFGRRRYLPELTSGKGAVRKFGERAAMNSPIQGTAADIIKIAMIRVRNALRAEVPDARLILQVHDELIVECRDEDRDAVSAILRREMEGAGNFAVPLSVELNAGKTWYDCK